VAIYTVLAPPPPSAAVEADPADYVFVKDGFCWPALFFAEIWMIFRRQWLVLLLYLIGLAIIFAATNRIDGPVPLVVLVFAHLLFALEANSLRRWTLTRHGYRLIGVAAGRRVGDAEIRFFHDLESPRRDPRQPPPSRVQAALGMPSIRPSTESGEVVGLFPAPGGRP
jgi:hypothetical protein